MAKFNREDVEKLSKWEETMKYIVINHAISTIPIEYRELISKMNGVLGFGEFNCSTCNSSLYAGTSRVYLEYLQSKNEYESRTGTTNDGDETKRKEKENNYAEHKRQRKNKKESNGDVS